ncbi:lipopolysaccharide heptosyltransferase I [Ramlibacter sp. G-1-2-2]|uniref:Lipopolysaccharide heptosyltransferase 1 n=1 Tax=Ramlibacter agri TaxID=2728837 RepID=A0A848H1K1_9BURK|nr:lipopolysaccharide heptosyltransferase I [Ramlibacter agri]
MNILIVKLSSLGDVVHAMPAVQDVLACVPQARVDWVVERGFAPLVQRCAGVQRAIPSDIRRWRKSPFSGETRHAWRAFRNELHQAQYDAVLDLQGLTKSALVSHMARLAPGGKRYAIGNRTEGSGYEAPTRWVADILVPVETAIHAVQRSRAVCAGAFGYELPAQIRYGLGTAAADKQNTIALVHGTSRADKCWPEDHWLELGRQLLAAGWDLALPHGSDQEQMRSEHLARALGPRAEVWPRLPLDALAERMGRCAGCIGVDSGLSHIAVALDLPHVQIYNFDTAWRTGPIGSPRQRSVYADPTPSVAAVWDAWTGVAAAA